MLECIGLVIGVGSYQPPLLGIRCAAHEAKLMLAGLKDLGGTSKVIFRHDEEQYGPASFGGKFEVPKADMKSLLEAVDLFEELLKQSSGRCWAFFSYSGHGLMGDDGKHYLVPNDVAPKASFCVCFEDRVLAPMRRHAVASLAVLDACRSLAAPARGPTGAAPFHLTGWGMPAVQSSSADAAPAAATRNVPWSLGGAYVCCATSPHSPALVHSGFSARLAQYLFTEGLSVGQAADRAFQMVEAAVGNIQVPQGITYGGIESAKGKRLADWENLDAQTQPVAAAPTTPRKNEMVNEVRPAAGGRSRIAAKSASAAPINPPSAGRRSSPGRVSQSAKNAPNNKVKKAALVVKGSKLDNKKPNHQAAGDATAAGNAQSAGPSSTIITHSDRVEGSLLGKMCGDVLGAGVEGWDAEQVLTANPDGLTDFQRTARGSFGSYTVDTEMAIALAHSLVECGGRVDDVRAARKYAEMYRQDRGYTGSTYQILSSMRRDGIDAESIRTIGTKYIPSGSYGNGGAMRIAPLGLVYRHAPPAVLREAVAAALRCTHVHPVAIDGAFVIALAVGYLATHAPGPALAAAAPAAPPVVAAAGAELATPIGLLDHVLSQRTLFATKGMAFKVEVVKAALLQATHFKCAEETWSHYFASPGWKAELRLQGKVAEPFQIRADDAAAAALGALCWHWDRPEDAIVAAVHYGGDTDTVAAITGAMAGALHGTHWLPARWINNLENNLGKPPGDNSENVSDGREEIWQLATSLAQYDTRS